MDTKTDLLEEPEDIEETKESVQEMIYCLEKTILFLQGVRQNDRAIALLEKCPSYKMMAEKAELTRTIKNLERYAAYLRSINLNHD